MERSARRWYALSSSLVALVALSACRADYTTTEGLDFACSSGGDCVEGYSCLGGRCVADGTDAGLVDRGGVDRRQDAGPGDTGRDAAPPDAVEPDTALSDAAEPDTAQTDAAEPDTALPDAAEPDAILPDAAELDTAFPDGTAPDTALPDAAERDAVQVDAAEPDAAEADASPGCQDVDGDSRAGYHPSSCPGGVDYCDSDIANWTADACANCADRDGDAHFSGCNSYPSGMPYDFCDDDPSNWTATGCLSCEDRDGDGYGASCDLGTDCDDGVPTCALDCETNSDPDEGVFVPDCVEEFCGSDMYASLSVCHLVASREDWDRQVAPAVVQDGEPNYILLDGFVMVGDSDDITTTDDLTIRQKKGTVLTWEGGAHSVIKAQGAGSIALEGLVVDATSEAKKGFELKTATATVSHCVVEGFTESGIHINGDTHAYLYDNVITGGTPGAAIDRAAIYVQSALRTRIVGNVIVDNVPHGISFKATSDVFIDHNTISANQGSGIYFGEAVSDLCVRNNDISFNADYALEVANVALGWNEVGGGCVEGSVTSPFWDNNAYSDGGGQCSGAGCGSCACLPGGASWLAPAVNPSYAASDTPSHVGYYCPDPTSDLVDVAVDLGYDLDPNDPANDYAGTSPDIGGRETGTSECGG